ncbi:MAG: outer membrane beta-barrel protein [[Clostridium] fimetarium]|nr:outer membrane beta-barrel protein [Alistipes timonensis]MCM1406286.1 outer membrane beta-barrel protein [[Clostridium] fimetarium]
MSPVEYARVELEELNRAKIIAGAYTDSLGRFQFDVTAPDSCRITVNAFGYHPSVKTIAKGTNTNPITITLEANSKALDEVTVTAEAVTRIDGGYRLIPSKNQVSHSVGGYNLLNSLMIPGVDVDRENGTVSARGSQTKLYINGIEASTREVQSLRAKDVLRVEYFDSPKGQYALDGTAINFVLKERTSGGYVDAVARQTIGFAKGTLDLTARFFNKNTRFTLYGGAGYNAYSGSSSHSTDTINFPDSRVIREKKSKLAKLRSNSEYLQFQVQNSNKKRTLRGDIIFGRDATPRNETNGSTKYSIDESRNFTTTTETTNRSTTGTLKLYGKFNIASNHMLEASVLARYGHNKYNYAYLQSETPGIESNVSEDNFNQRANLKYVWNADKKNTLSAVATYSSQINDAEYRGTITNNQHIFIGLGTGGVSWQHRFGKWTTNLMPGIAASLYHTRGYKTTQNYSPSLTISLDGQPGKNDFIFFEGYMGVSYPPTSFMTSAIQYIDPLEVSVGNPELDVTRMYMGTLVYGIGIGKVNLQWFARYLLQNNAIAYRYDTEGELLVRALRSDTKNHIFVTNISGTWRPNNKFSISGSASYSYQGNKVPGETTPWVNLFIGRAQASYYIGKFSINANYESPNEISSYGLTRIRTSHKYGASASFATSGWLLEAGFNNLFLKPATDSWTYSRSFSGLSTRKEKTDMSHGYIRVSYSVDFGKKMRHTKEGPDRSTSESAILRAN